VGQFASLGGRQESLDKVVIVGALRTLYLHDNAVASEGPHHEYEGSLHYAPGCKDEEVAENQSQPEPISVHGQKVERNIKNQLQLYASALECVLEHTTNAIDHVPQLQGLDIQINLILEQQVVLVDQLDVDSVLEHVLLKALNVSVGHVMIHLKGELHVQIVIGLLEEGSEEFLGQLLL
jgi:hypothetical protein